MTTSAQHKSILGTWTIIILMAAGILSQGFYAFMVIGDRGQPTWEYRPVKDIPGESPYANYRVLPYPQHVAGERGE